MIQTKVKISNTTNLSDARYCAGMGVEMLGFSMDELPVEKFQEIRNWVAGVQIVGETEAEDFEEINNLVQKFQPDYLQISHWQRIVQAQSLGLPIILKIDFQEPDLSYILQSVAQSVKYFLIENTDEFAHLDTETLNTLSKLGNQYSIILGFGLKENNVKEVLHENIFEGIALQGSDEIRPGFKDFDELMNILEILDED